MTPLKLEILLHCFYSAEPIKVTSEIRSAALYGLIECGAVQDSNVGMYRTTPLGRAWVEEILATPLPKLQYVGASGKVYEA